MTRGAGNVSWTGREREIFTRSYLPRDSLNDFWESLVKLPKRMEKFCPANHSHLLFIQFRNLLQFFGHEWIVDYPKCDNPEKLLWIRFYHIKSEFSSGGRMGKESCRIKWQWTSDEHETDLHKEDPGDSGDSREVKLDYATVPFTILMLRKTLKFILYHINVFLK